MTLAGLRPGEKLFEEKLMAEEGLKKTKNKLIHIRNIFYVNNLLTGKYQEEKNLDVSGKSLDFKDVKGQDKLIEAAVLAAAGGHNMLMIGEPGCGKTMIAQRIPTILPEMTEEECLEVTKIHSISGLLPSGHSLMKYRPFRAPHHNASLNALIGGGVNAMPGESEDGTDVIFTADTYWLLLECPVCKGISLYKSYTDKLFDDRCHYHELWKGEDLQEETVLSFLDKQRDYLRIMNLSSFNELYFVKSDQEIIEALGKLRWVDNFVDIVYEVLNKDKDFSDMSIIGIRKALWKIFDVAKEHKIMWQGRNFTEDSFMQEDLLTICRWIMEI